jgi:rubredoxin
MVTPSIDYLPTLGELRFLVARKGLPEEAYMQILWRRRYGSTSMECPKCHKQSKFYPLTARPKSYACKLCGWHVSPTAGTIFHKTYTPLSTWFNIIYWLYLSEGKMPVKELQRRTGVGYKTAWRLKHLVAPLLDLEDKGYSYKFSSARNGRYSQLEAVKV